MNILKDLNIYGYDGHLGHVTYIIIQILSPGHEGYTLMCSASREQVHESINLSDLAQRPTITLTSGTHMYACIHCTN